MHHALSIQEILLNIFSRCLRRSYGWAKASDLVALARTCRAFKELALDILWSNLNDLSPLARCIPGASHRTFGNVYSFTRPLTETELDTLRSYARRVASIRHFKGLGWDSIRTFVDLPRGDSVLPNLQSLECDYTKDTAPLLQLPLPSLTDLTISLSERESLRLLPDPLKSLSKFSPNIKRLNILGCQPDPVISGSISDRIFNWLTLQTVRCPKVSLDVDVLFHLSRIPALTRLEFMLGPTSARQIPSDLQFSFPRLHCLQSHGNLLVLSILLSQAKLPLVTEFTAVSDTCPSREELASFLASMRTSGMSHTIQEFKLIQEHNPNVPILRGSEALVLGLDDLLPCMSFHNLRHFTLDLEWNVGLRDGALLTLTSAWPKLEWLRINEEWGWNVRGAGGITPNGLAQLLQECRHIFAISLVIDTEAYIEAPPCRPFESQLRPFMPTIFRLNVIDSVIDEGSEYAIASFIASIAPHFDIDITAWEARAMSTYPNMKEYACRWGAVRKLVKEALKTAFLNHYT